LTQAMVVSLALLLFFSLSKYGQSQQERGFLSPVVYSGFSLGRQVKGDASKPLDRYSFENLSLDETEASSLEIGRTIKEEKKYTAYYFYYTSNEERVSGQLNAPIEGKDLPVVIMVRGYADKEIYFTGLGTRKAAGFFAENGFVTLAPDFLGFGQSDSESADILLNRFRRPETVLALLASLKNLNDALRAKGLSVTVDPSKLVFWGHSNGGQIVISVLEITRAKIPTVLWAPVTESFPESVLQYASELDDEGKKVIEAIKNFKKDYDPAKYSITNYFQQIQAPLQIHQGTGDEYIAVESSDRFVGILNKLGKNTTYYVYKNDDHNLKDNWNIIVERDLEFFRKYL